MANRENNITSRDIPNSPSSKDCSLVRFSKSINPLNTKYINAPSKDIMELNVALSSEAKLSCINDCVKGVLDPLVICPIIETTRMPITEAAGISANR